VQLTPKVAVSWDEAWLWATGERPLAIEIDGHRFEVDAEQFEGENQPHHRQARFRELLDWEERLEPLREALQRVTEEVGAPPEGIRGYVDFWITARRVFAPVRRLAKDMGRFAREVEEARQRGEPEDVDDA
jgi:hypothetical protein